MKMVKPLKRFGQHFLKDSAACLKIVESLNLEPGDQVLEIGPGTGGLTKHLLKKVERIVAVEVERNCVALMRKKFSDEPGLEILQADFMELNLENLLQTKNWKVVGNLPYNLASSILLRILEWSKYFKILTFMFQKEVAERIVARSGSKKFGYLSVAAQLRTTPEILFTLEPSAFRPKPKVHSSVVRFFPKTELLPGIKADPRAFLNWVDFAFRQRRKMAINHLKSPQSCDMRQKVFNSLGISAKARPEDISTELWQKLYLSLR